MVKRSSSAEIALLDLLDLPEWMDRAACKGVDSDVFFAERGNTQQARNICSACPVRQECLDYAIDTRQDGGIWGGLGVKARRRFYSETERVSGNGTCLIEDCSGTRAARGWCNKHYIRFRRHGSPYWEPPATKVTPEILEKMEGLTHAEVGRRLGVDPTHVWRMRRRMANA